MIAIELAELLCLSYEEVRNKCACDNTVFGAFVRHVVALW